MGKYFLQSERSGVCCEPCAEAVLSGIKGDDVLSLLPDDHVATIGRSRRGGSECNLCGYKAEFDVLFEYVLHTIQEFGK